MKVEDNLAAGWAPPVRSPVFFSPLPAIRLHCRLLFSARLLSSPSHHHSIIPLAPLTQALKLLLLDLMEAAEDASLEAAIGWLAQTILGSLLMDKLAAWIRQAGLADDIESLKSVVEKVEMVVSAVKGRAIGNKPLARSLARLKELLYNADDVVDEIDYYRLQQQVEGVIWDDPESMHAAGERSRGSTAEDIPSGSGGSLRSKLWKEFKITKWDGRKAVEAKCIHCGSPPIKCGSGNGTSVLKNHLKSKGCIRKHGASEQPPNPSSTVDATTNATPAVSDYTTSRKRRADEGTTQTTTAKTHTPWDKAELSSRIQKMTSQLQDTQGEVSDFLKILGPDSFARSNHCPSDQRLRTSSLVQRKMYGRSEEKEYIIKLMTEHKSSGLTVLPILGTAGVGKTALAQHVYNDPVVESQFDHKIWVCVSSNFDETRISREMLDIVPQEMHKGLCSFAKPQEVFKNHIKSGRVLVVLDDVSDEVNDCWWNQLLAPYNNENANGNVILVTTRKISVAKRIGTTGPIKLGALENNYFWQLFKACAFSDEYYKGHISLSIIGQQIAKQLKGNSLAAVTAGALLRDDCTVDHWSNILKNEDWKSLEFIGGIMPAFKLSYDQLPYQLQQCFSYCSIFPYNHEFLDEELVRIWISQGFVKCNHSSQRLEEIGRCYLIDLVNLGFFQQVKKEESFVGGKSWYAICGLMHDFARIVSRTECATIDRLQYNKMPPTIRHLSIVTDFAYNKDQDGNITRNNDFEKNLRKTVTSVRKLRTLVLVGKYDPLFFQLLQDIFQKAHHLRLLQISASPADFNYLICSLVNPAHVRYLKRKFDEVGGVLPQVLSKFYHLQVLDVGLNTDPTAPNCMNNLVSLQHLVAEEGVHSSIARIGEMTSLQKLKFSVQDSSGFEITQLQSMNELVHLEVYELKNVKTRKEAYGAKLRDKRHLETLYLSWKHNDILSLDEFYNDISSEVLDMVYLDEVLEGLEPNLDLKHLHISGYNGICPTWLASNITSLQTLRLEDCGKWEILPPLERLPFLTKLELRNMQKVIEVLVPSLEELVLVNMPKLERCSCTPIWDLDLRNCSQITQLLIEEEQDSQSNLTSAHAAAAGPPDVTLTGSTPVDEFNFISPLKNIFIEYCPDLTFNMGKKGLSRFTSLEKVKIGGCPQMLWSLVHKYKIDDRANGRWLLPQSLRELEIYCDSTENLQLCFIGNQTRLTKLDVSYMPGLKSLQLHSCTALEGLTINVCESLVALEGLPSLGRLRCLEIDSSCPSLRPFMECFLIQGPELCPQLSRLETLSIPGTSFLTTSLCKHVSSLRDLQLSGWNNKTTRLTGEQELALQFLTSLRDLEFRHFENLVDLPAELSKLLFLKNLRICWCNGLSKLTGMVLPASLQELNVWYCEKLVDLPAGLHELPFLKKLQIINCDGISRLPSKGLPHSLEILGISGCSQELTDECRKLATGNLKVQINWEWTN